nr:immunoglobulin heavy chain junction region [Mus musculus]
CAKMGTYFDYW